ncbi:MAG: polyhydroxyalkanoate synthesis repressor PhaR [Alphaproteobacteria bacterium]|nr:polyhydroxyalkanoate synthesis repressor PhaR [Alphaproteobacteria bacterium]
MAKKNTGDTVIIKKYANRRLYDTSSSSYVTLDHLASMIKEKKNFVVQDAKSAKDITRTVLTQIIVEEESKGETLLPIGFLRQLIGFYGNSVGKLVPSYLEMSLQSFATNEDKMHELLQNTFHGMFPTTQFETIAQNNVEMYRKAISMFSPMSSFYNANEENSAAITVSTNQTAKDAQKIGELEKRLNQMQMQLNDIKK